MDTRDSEYIANEQDLDQVREELDDYDSYEDDLFDLDGCVHRVANGCLPYIVALIIIPIVFSLVQEAFRGCSSTVNSHDSVSVARSESDAWRERLSGVKVEFDAQVSGTEQGDGDGSSAFTQIAFDEPIDLGTAIVTVVKVESSFHPLYYKPSSSSSRPTPSELITWSEDGVHYPKTPSLYLDDPGMYLRVWFNVKYASCSFDVEGMYASMAVGEAQPQYTRIALYPADGTVDRGSTVAGIQEMAREYQQQLENARAHPGEIDWEGLLCVEGHFKLTDIKANDSLKVKLGISDDALKVVLPEDEPDEDDAGASEESADREEMKADTDNYTMVTTGYVKVPIRKNNFGIDGFDECEHLFGFDVSYKVVGEKDY